MKWIWTEVFIGDKWIPVDAVNSLIDGSLKLESMAEGAVTLTYLLLSFTLFFETLRREKRSYLWELMPFGENWQELCWSDRNWMQGMLRNDCKHGYHLNIQYNLCNFVIWHLPTFWILKNIGKMLKLIRFLLFYSQECFDKISVKRENGRWKTSSKREITKKLK